MDIDVLAGRIGLEPEEYLELLELFCDTAESELNRLRDFLQANDSAGAARAAHSLRGAAGNMGLENIAADMRRIEARLQTRKAAEVLRAAAAVQDQLSGLREHARCGCVS